MTSKFIFAAILILLSFQLSAQNGSNIKNDCFNKYRGSVPVEKFKDQLKLKLRVDSLYDGNDKKLLKINHSETIENEASIIVLNEKYALKVNIARATDYKEKIYLYKIELLKKVGECWEPVSQGSLWHPYTLGSDIDELEASSEDIDDYLAIVFLLTIE